MQVSDHPGNTPARKVRKKRLPKACGACRNAKAKCNGQSPCSRCRHLKKECIFEQVAKDDKEIKIESLEKEIADLRSKLHAASVTGTSSEMAVPGNAPSEESSGWLISEQLGALPAMPGSDSLKTPSNGLPAISPSSYVGSHVTSSLSPQVVSLAHSFNPSKRRRTHLEVESDVTTDFLAMGLISPAEAESYFQTFFQGCHQYVPVLDHMSDTIDQVRARSGVLFSVICATGCRILKGTDSQAWHLLNFHIRRLLNVAVGSPSRVTLETIQALLIRACYISERSFLTTLATRFAIELGIPESFEELSSRCISPTDSIHSSLTDEDQLLIRKSRTWLHLLNIGHILHVDASDLLVFKVRGNARRCRVLLQGALTTDLDLHLVAQVELNVLRAEAYSALSKTQNLAEEEIIAVVREARMDIDVWFNDWLRIFSRASSGPRELWLAQNLQIQRCWADTMALCRAIRVSGVENVEAMSPAQREMLTTAKASLETHLSIIIQEPRHYLQNLRFAMDFVWAKCAFCFLLLLKLSMLLPDNCEESSRELLEHGRTLIRELRIAGGGNGNGHGSISRSGTDNSNGTRRVYLQLLQVGLEKFSRTALGESISPLETSSTTGGSTPPLQTPGVGGGGSGCGEGGGSSTDQQHNELESFVPDQFVFEWDFPGLTLFSCPTTEASWLDDFLSNALIGDEDFYNFGYYPVYKVPDMHD